MTFTPSHLSSSVRMGAAQGQGAGVGLLIGGRRVMLVYPDGPADRAGVRAGDIIEAVDHSPFYPPPGSSDPSALMGCEAELTLRRAGITDTITVTVEQGPYSQYLAPTGRRLAGDLGFVQLPGVLAPGRNVDCVAAARSVIVAVDQSPTRGADYADQPGATLQRANPPVAVLTGPLTASAGEVATLAFVGRCEARLFGETTGGFTTGVEGYQLFDGTKLALATTAMTDRRGDTHLSGIEPDESVAIDWETYGTNDDPVLQAAIAWLNQQPAPGATPAVP